MPSPDPAAGGLVVTSPGAVLVASDALLAHLPVLARLGDEVEADTHRLALLALDSAPSALRARLERCEQLSGELAEEVRRLREGIIAAESGYATAERLAEHAQGAASDWLAGQLPRLLLPLLPSVAAGAWLGWTFAPGSDEQKRESIRIWLLQHPELVTSPEFAALVRNTVTGADDAVAGAAGLPPAVTVLLGDYGLGILGADTSAAALVAAGTASGTQLFHETAVRVERVGVERRVAAPTGAAERLDRVPEQQQVRIEKYSAPGAEDRFVVYVAPTRTFSPLADEEPWDLTSNVAGVAGLPAGSIRATELAMADAGITAESPVVLVGFSQGGLIADAIAGSGRWNTYGLESYGDPGGGIAMPDGIRGLAIRHTDDFVVATGGPQQTVDRVIVERRAYPEGVEIPRGIPAPAHQRSAYAQTAELLDAARSPEVRGELDALARFTGEYAERDGATTTAYRYQAVRLPADAGVSDAE
ncbi:hypothetical protein [Protaetiibacter larvae]|uniref:Uncharacterized protein n=1 Tax=Protaetiibacter larvae TaxID=2592654 RepID=A0A5C1Y7X1_9MICO|nr:hypothetical protein [Protaetiibacter larvae]QEO09022.1 hypothetical protein FLP23_02715 [Protaetiibacter larvae]